MKFHYETECPRCGKKGEVVMTDIAKAPRVNCGDCLMERVEVVPMLCLLKVIEYPKKDQASP
jgi:ribosomal protein S27AE